MGQVARIHHGLVWPPSKSLLLLGIEVLNSLIQGQLCLQEQRRDMNRELKRRNGHRIERIGIKNGFLIQAFFSPDLKYPLNASLFNYLTAQASCQPVVKILTTNRIN